MGWDPTPTSAATKLADRTSGPILLVVVVVVVARGSDAQLG